MGDSQQNDVMVYDGSTPEMRKPNRFNVQTLSVFSVLILLLIVVLFGLSMSGNTVVITTNPITETSLAAPIGNINTAVHPVSKAAQLHLLISVTSGPAHASLRMAARESWLLPCLRSSLCDYRFFCDIVESNVTEALATEQELYRDMVFRGPWCRFMHERHHHSINYGNYMDGFGSEKLEIHLPDYPLRLMYKVDWKVCFTKWAVLHDKVALYHVYVEDDSFNCVDNLLHQVQILHKLNATSAAAVNTSSTNSSSSSSSSNKDGSMLPPAPMRAGYPMYGHS